MSLDVDCPRHGHLRPVAALAVLILSLALLAGYPPTRAYAVTNTPITVDGTSSGRTCDGIGAISGGGDNTRLLYDYPATQRGEILDYLFKPGYGADLHLRCTKVPTISLIPGLRLLLVGISAGCERGPVPTTDPGHIFVPRIF
jgi:hypothetical protein